MARPRSRSMDLKIMCAIWRDADFASLSAGAQLALFRGIGMMGRAASNTTAQYTASDFGFSAELFADSVGELSYIGAWRIVDSNTVEVSNYKNLAFVVPRHRSRIPEWLRRLILDRDGHRCVSCGATDRLEMDHIHPWALGGREDPDNLQTLCRSCNYAKGMSV